MTTQPTSQPGADQPLVTHADLEALRLMRDWAEGHDPTERIVDRLIQAAEADKPALPEGWVLACKVPGDHRTVKWSHGQGLLTNGPDVSPADNVATWRIEEYASVTPLVTAASLVPEGWHVEVGEKPGYDGLDVILDADGSAVMFRCDAEATFERDDIFDVLAALVSAAHAERGESR